MIPISQVAATDLRKTPKPFDVSLESPLSMSVVGQSYWPPIEGDLLNATFQIKNNENKAITITYGVSGECALDPWTLNVPSPTTINKSEIFLSTLTPAHFRRDR